MANRIQTLEGVKVGDKFVIFSGWASRDPVIVKCTRLTPKQAIIGSIRYKIENARPIGSRRFLYPIDQDELKRTAFEQRKRVVGNFTYGELNNDDIEAVYKIIFNHRQRLEAKKP